MPVSRISRWGRDLTRIGATCCVTLAVAFVAALWVLPRTGTVRGLSVLTGSMSPSIPAGSLIFIRPVDPQTVAIGDVITFRPPSNAGVLVTHRVVGYGVEMNQQRSFRTKGDANSSADPDPVAATAVIGRVVYRAPYLGTLVARAHTTTGVALLLVLPLFLALGGRLRRHTIPAPSGARPTTS